MYKPKLHITPINNWMNDPNGLIYFNHEYHIFYQYFPYEPVWGTMHWGHKTSKDLVHFKDQGIALYPSKAYDANGCFSGSAIEVEQKLYLYYTGVKYTQTSEEDIHRSSGKIIQCQAMLISEDGYNFNNNAKQMIIPPIEDASIGDYYDARDPKVFKIKDTYFIVLGTKKDNKGRILIYESKDAINWNLKSINEDERLGDMVECPDLYNVDGKWIMTVSPMHTNHDGINYTSNCQYMLIDFDPDTGKITFESDPRLIDLGYDYYAAQTFKDENNQTVILGWLRMPVPSHNWNGLYTFPRVIEYKNNHVYYHVHPSILKEFTSLSDTIDDQNAYWISVDVQEGSDLNIAGYLIKVQDGAILTDRSQVFAPPQRKPIGTQFKTPVIKGDIHLDIFLDQNVIEIYINDGYYVLSNIIYHQSDELSFKEVKNLWIKKAQ